MTPVPEAMAAARIVQTSPFWKRWRCREVFVPEVPRQPDVRTIIDGALDAVVTMNELGSVTEWSRSAEELFGWSREEVLGATLSELIVPPSLRSAHNAGLAHFRSTGEGPVLNQILELSAVRRDGEEFPVELAISRAMVTPAGTTFIGFIRDVSDRRRAERQARRGTELIRLLGRVATAANSASRVDDAAAVILREACDHTDWVVGHVMFPAAPGEGATKDVWYLADEARFAPFRESSEAIRASLLTTWIPGQVLATALPEWVRDVRVEKRFSRPEVAARVGLVGGYWFPVLVGGEAVGVFEFFSTEAAVPDEDVLVSVRGLGSALGRVFERERAVQRLEEALRAAQAASDAKSHYLGRISHELRTPLTAILGYGELLEMDNPRPDQAQPLAVINQAGQHLLDLVNEVLDIARIEAGREEFLLEPLALADVVDDCVALLRPKADEQDVRLRIDAGGVRQTVLADRQRLAQVLINLLSNAVKYNRQAGEVRVSARREGADRVVVTITDTGLGIPAADLPRLFDPFDRLGAERRGIEGTGLGLALSRRLVEGMNGQLSATSVLGEGTVLELVLPATAAAGVPRGTAVAPAVASGAGERLHRVLYVEDDPTTFLMMERLLARRPQVTVITAMQGSLAIELAREHRPELIVLDLHLPDMDGAEVLRNLRGDPRTASIPVVILTADATPRQRERLLEAGAHAYLIKPVRVRDFLDLVDGVFAGR
ncbi:MAG: hypothetical protein NVSMB29_08570 [Candidatus Dormibacteria bacterium]